MRYCAVCHLMLPTLDDHTHAGIPCCGRCCRQVCSIVENDTSDEDD